MAQLMSEKQANEWNKIQADQLRRIADQVEKGKYEQLDMSIDTTYTLAGGKPFRRTLVLKVDFLEADNG